MLHFDRYKKSYDTTTIVEIPDLQLENGIYWLKGDNGSGKTTLLKSIAGLTPYEGSITVAGCAIQQQRMHYKKIVNYAEAEPMYPAFLTGNELLQFYYKTKGGSNELPMKLIHAFGADKYLHQKVGTYSSGMLKKLSLVAAFVGAPQLILLDEPLITLDTDAVVVLQNSIAQSAQNGASFIMTSHQNWTTTLFQASTLLLKNGNVTLV